MTGNPGAAGDDGYDIELTPEEELPCSICPAGPPGQRSFIRVDFFFAWNLFFDICVEN